MAIKLQRYASFSREHLQPFFAKAHVPYPPNVLALLIFKKSKRLQLYAKVQQRWHYIKTFPVLAASGEPGPKLHVGDDQVPEGIYRIIGLNPESHFDLSMHLNYPNRFDRKHAKQDHRTDLGGDIFIHGNRRSIGCIAIGNVGIQQLFPLVYQVGINHVTVIIAPNDLRLGPPVYGKMYPKWLPILYRKIKHALRRFPLP